MKTLKQKIVEELDEQWDDTNHYYVWEDWIKEFIFKIIDYQKRSFKKKVVKEIKKYKCGKHKRLLKVIKEL